jgi:hypothetical protein
MAFKDFHIGNNMAADVQFPCPDCNDGTMAKGHFQKTSADKAEHKYIDVPCCCPKGHEFQGDAALSGAGLDVEVQIHDKRIKDNQLQVSVVP